MYVELHALLYSGIQMHEYKSPSTAVRVDRTRRNSMIQSSNPLLEVGNDQHTTPTELHTTPSTVEAKIFIVLGEMKKQGFSEYTITFNRKALSYLAKHSDLDNPESVKGYIATLDRKSGYKRNLMHADFLLRFHR